MAAPIMQGSSAIVAGLTNATITPILPAHQADDILIVCALYKPTITELNIATSGWALLDSSGSGGGGLGGVAWFWKRATSGAETNPAVSVVSGSGDHYAQAHVIRGCITSGNPWDVFASQAFTTTDPFSASGITTTVADTLICVIGGDTDDAMASVVVTASDPTTFSGGTTTDNRWVESTSGTDGTLFIAFATKASALPTGNISLNWSAAPDGGAILKIAFKPPASGTPHTTNPADTLSLSDSATVTIGRSATPADTISLADALVLEQQKTFADSLGLADATRFTREVFFADSFVLNDSATANLGKEIFPADGLSLSDSATTESGKEIQPADSFSLADAIALERQIAIPDTISLADGLSFERQIAVADALTLADAIALTFGISIADALALADFADPVKTTGGGAAHEIFPEDSITLSDALSFIREIVLTDSITVSDSHARQLNGVFLPDGSVAVMTPRGPIIIGRF
jgi:hypothetical protein